MFIRLDELVTPLARSVETADFSDLTSAQRNGQPAWVVEDDITVGLEIPFDSEPTAAERAAILQRITTSGDVEERLRVRARGAYQNLRTIRDSTGTLTTAQLSNAVRHLAGALMALIRIAFRDLDSVD